MPDPLNLPELLPPSRRRPRWQFGLWYLFSLTTVAAVVAGIARHLTDVPWLFVGMLVYVLGFVCYVAVRLPRLIQRLSPEWQRVRENRRRLAEWAEKKRHES